MTWQSAGGKATALISRKKALDAYYLAPRICKECKKIIEVGEKKVPEIRKKVFCSSACSAIFNNQRRTNPELVAKRKQIRLERQRLRRKEVHGTRGLAKVDYGNLTKGETFSQRKNWQTARSGIRKHAERIITNSDIPKICKCGHSKHVEICHIKSVSSFNKESKISEINDLTNLIYLCPNCHWEFDNKIKSPYREAVISQCS